MISLRFRNLFDRPLTLSVEPWASEIEIAAGSHFVIHYPPPDDRPDTSFAELENERVTFWCEGQTFEVDVDGVPVLT